MRKYADHRSTGKKTLIADKGYDADASVQAIRAAGAKAVMASRSNQVDRGRIGRRYRTRNLVERFFNPIKPFRQVATRYAKLADSNRTFASLACIYGWVGKMWPEPENLYAKEFAS